jgi:crossover junction endodeoxyribonuclease RusA
MALRPSDLRNLLVVVPGRPFSLNRERTQHWAVQARRTKELRKVAYDAALDEIGGSKPAEPMFEQVTISVFPCALDRRYRQDIANCYPSFKACLDGIVDANVIEDDNDRHVLSVKFYPHQYGKDQMALLIKEVA